MKTNWKPIEIEGNLLSGGLEGLVGIEECSEYDLNEVIPQYNKRKLPSETPEPKKKKRKPVKKPNKNGNNEQTCETLTPSKCGQTNQGFEEASESHRIPVEAVDDPKDVEAWEGFGIPKQILRALSELNFHQPTAIQSLTFPSAILGRCDILGAAETGSGKTLAFGIPILTGILKIKENETGAEYNEADSDSELDEEDLNDEAETGCVKVINNIEMKKAQQTNPLYALILTPTRELAMQIKSHLDAVAKYTGIYIALVVGGMAAVKQERILSKGPEIVVGTPGRLWELVQNGNPHLSKINDVRFLAIDEADRMLESGHFQELQDILERINIDSTTKKQRQNFVFSATLTLVHELPAHLKFKKSKNIKELTAPQKLKKIVDTLGVTSPKVVDISEGKGTSSTLTECKISCTLEEKDYYVYYFLKRHPGKTIIFCNSIGCVKRLATLLTLLDCHPLPLHACMAQRQRLKNLEKFKETENSLLICTDVAARGLDIPSAFHVLHYQTPRTSELYVHRSGRTARLNQDGITVLMVSPGELQSYVKLCKTLGKSEDLPIFPVQKNYLDNVKQRVNLARELDHLQLQVQKANSEKRWYQKAAHDMDIIVDDDAKKYDSKETNQLSKVIATKKKQLAAMLNKPVFPKGFSGKYPLGPQMSVHDVQKEESAIEVMKNAIANDAAGGKKKRKLVPLFKNRKSVQSKEDLGVSYKLPKNLKVPGNKGRPALKKKRRNKRK
nr:unnamed protein product [Callosobruchus chinensis]